MKRGEPRDLPIPFSIPMVEALLAGRKTVTRRVLKPQFPKWVRTAGFTMFTPPRKVSGRGTFIDENGTDFGPSEKFAPLKYCQGDRLWVREPWRVSQHWDKTKPSDLSPRSTTVFFLAGGSIANQSEDGLWRPDDWPEHRGLIPLWAGRNRPGIFLPRWASRTTLLVENVRVERLQAITAEDAIAEGIERFSTDFGQGWGIYDRDLGRDGKPGYVTRDPVESYASLWRSINGPKSWEQNPWVTVTTFAVVRQNIDAIPKEKTDG